MPSLAPVRMVEVTTGALGTLVHPFKSKLFCRRVVQLGIMALNLEIKVREAQLLGLA